MPYDNLDVRVNAITIAELNKLAADGVRIFREEMPRKTGNMRQKTKMTPAKKMPDGSFMAEIVIDTPYARAVDLGIPESEGQIQTAKGNYMVFEDWPNGPDALRWLDGKFRFKKVKHVVRADNFSKRAIGRIRALGKKTLFTKINDGIKKLFGAK